MNRRIYIFHFVVFCLLFTSRASAQASVKSKHHSSALVTLDFAGFYTPILGLSVIGFNMDLKGYVTKRWSSGICFSIASKHIPLNFGYPMAQPIINYYEWGWNNQYDLATVKRIRFFADLDNGLVRARLGDDKEHVLSGYSRYGNLYLPKKYSENYYYLLEPGVGVSIPIYYVGQKNALYITAKAKYRFVFGQSHFSSSDQFSNYYMSIGLTFFTGD